MKKKNKLIRTSLLACAAMACISWSSASAEGVVFPSFENRLTKGQTIVIEGEDAIYGPDMEVMEDSLTGGAADKFKVSGGKVLAFTENSEVYQKSATQNPSFLVNFGADATTYYRIFLRIRPRDAADAKKKALLYYHVDGEKNDSGTDYWRLGNVMNLNGGTTSQPAYIWQELVPSRLTKSGNVCIKFKFARTGSSYTADQTAPFMIDKIIVTADKSFAHQNLLNPTLPGEDFYSDEFSLDEIPIFPDEQEHPRLLITKDEIPALKERLKDPHFKSRYESIAASASKSFTGLLQKGNTEYRNNSSILTTLENRAFMYLIGEVDAAHADRTIEELKNFMATVTFDLENGTYMSRYAGHVTTVAACVYDWCHDRMTDVDKEFIRRWVYQYQNISEVGYPPIKRFLLTGHGIEEQITHHQMMAAIAFYDEDPDWYRVVASVVFDRMMPGRNVFVSSGYGESYGSYFAARDIGFAMLNKMIKALGYEDEIHHEKYPDTFKPILYMSLPNGIWMKDGDDYTWSRYLPDTKSTNFSRMMAYIGTEYDDPYLLRQGIINYAWNSSNYSAQELLMIDPTKEQRELDELPTTWKTQYPMTMMMARTGWQMGLNSNTAVAFMNGREINIVDHQHRDAGTFQLYYKGMLAIDSGLYSDWNDWHHRNYTARTVAHNSMLIYDPDYEAKYEAYFKEQTGKNLPSTVVTRFSNEDVDGGQRTFDTCGGYSDLLYDNGKVDSDYAAKTLGTYIGPNSQTPAFSYLSTDLSLGYDYRTDGYRRSMVFMDLFNDDYPAAMIVYDRVNATDKSYKKTWLLHSEQEPTIEGTVTTITRTDNGQNGKLVNYTLLPAEDNASIVKIGGPGNEFFVNGTNYMYDEKAQNVFAYQHDSGTWRIELSPKTQANDDLFLNAMYVTDADGNLPQLPIIKEETDTYAGAVVMDRMVTFSKAFAPISQNFKLTVPNNGYQTVSCLLTDMAPGKWRITGGGKNIYAESKEGETCLSFTAAPGTYTVAPITASVALTQFETPAATKKGYGDFLIRKNNNLMYLPKPNKLVDGVPYVAVDTMAQLGATVTEKTNTTVTLTFTKNNSVAVLTKDATNYTLNGQKKTLTKPVLWIDGEPYVYLYDFRSNLGVSSYSYNATIRLMKFSK